MNTFLKNVYILKIKRACLMGYSLSKANFKLKIEGTYLGVLWYLLEPFVMFFTLKVIFSPRIGIEIPHYSLYLLIGVLMFHFFSKSTNEAITSIFKQGAFIRSLKVEPLTFVLSSYLVSLYTHIGDVLFLTVCFIIWGGPLGHLLFYPLILFFFSLFILGVSFLLASLGAFAQDFTYFWKGVCMVLWFITPIFYAHHSQEMWVYFNPIYYYISIARDLMIYQRVPNPVVMMVAASLSFSFLFLGILVFEKCKDRFAESV